MAVCVCLCRSAIHHRLAHFSWAPRSPPSPHNQNTFGPTEGQNEQWREANRRRQRQTNQHHRLVPNPPLTPGSTLFSPYGTPIPLEKGPNCTFA